MNRIPNWAKIIFGIVTLIFSVVLYDKIIEAATLIFDSGYDMYNLRSQAGNSVAEHYYQLHGAIYACFGKIIKELALVIPFTGIVMAFISIYPVVKENKDKIKNKIDTIKNTTQCVAHMVSQEAENVQTPTSKFEYAPEPVSEPTHEDVFCANCGERVSKEMDFCTRCGNKMNK
ncbi:MAG: zinc ribbon domain-containing protein [Oscillospiraceae bacterium]|nr:zinc ribbon domain-containing protein [Oscillospiraceae bacterium]